MSRYSVAEGLSNPNFAFVNSPYKSPIQGINVHNMSPTSTPEFCHLPAFVIVPSDEIVFYLQRSDYMFHDEIVFYLRRSDNMFLNLIPCKRWLSRWTAMPPGILFWKIVVLYYLFTRHLQKCKMCTVHCAGQPNIMEHSQKHKFPKNTQIFVYFVHKMCTKDTNLFLLK